MLIPNASEKHQRRRHSSRPETKIRCKRVVTVTPYTHLGANTASSTKVIWRLIRRRRARGLLPRTRLLRHSSLLARDIPSRIRRRLSHHLGKVLLDEGFTIIDVSNFIRKTYECQEGTHV